MNLHYYAQRKAVKNGAAITPVNYSYTKPDEAERQYYLLCAAAISNSDGSELISVEWGSIEQGAVEHKCWTHTPAQAEE